MPSDHSQEAPSQEPTSKPTEKHSFIDRLKHAPRFFHRRDKVVVAVAVVVVLCATVYALASSYLGATVPVPQEGGKYTEGIVGEPKFINPLYDQTTDADQDITALVFSGLMKLDENYEIVPDLVESFEISEDKKTYDFKLREDVKWHDGETFDVEDVMFTIRAIQDPDYASPLRNTLRGVEVERKGPFRFTLTLRDQFSPFLSNLTFGILPAHIWQNIPPQNATVVEDNRKPVGTGPYMFSELTREKDSGKILTFIMERNEGYYGSQPLIDEVVFEFFLDPDTMISAFNSKRIDGMNFVDPENLGKITRDDITVHEIQLPVYSAVFLNPDQNPFLENINIRRALSYAINKQQLVDDVLDGHGIPVEGALLPGFLGFTKNVDTYAYDPEKAQNILREAGFTKNENDGFFYKNDNKLTIQLETTDWPQNAATAEKLKSFWNSIGIEANVRTFSVSEIQQTFIRPRNFEALLFSQNLGTDSDLYPFWHSSQSFDPGLNLSFLKDEELDTVLERGRSTHQDDERASKYEAAQRIIAQQVGALFLYSPNYIYPVSDELQGFSLSNISAPSDRFINVEQRYLKTKRVSADSEEANNSAAN